MPATSTLLYGATRAGKTKLLTTMAELGRLVVSDADGQLAAECPDAYKMELPPVLPQSATPAEQEERARVRDARLAVARDARIVIWPAYTPTHHESLQGALRRGVLGEFTTLGVDSLTFALEAVIVAICGTTVIYKKGSDNEEEASDPVLRSLPDFSGAGVHRPMDKKDWMRFATKALDLVVGTLRLAAEKNMHCVMTALEIKREIWEGEGRARRLIGTQQGPLIQGRAAVSLIPPKFQFFFRCAAEFPESGPPKFGVFTQPRAGWPAGVRGRAITDLPPVVMNPNLPEILRLAGML